MWVWIVLGVQTLLPMRPRTIAPLVAKLTRWSTSPWLLRLIGQPSDDGNCTPPVESAATMTAAAKMWITP